MGLSGKNSSTVPMVLNPDTGAIMPQFHVIFDDWFSTIASDGTDLPDFQSDEWMKMFGESEYQFIYNKQDTQEEHIDLNGTKQSTMYQQWCNRIAQAIDMHQPVTPLPVPPPVTQPKTCQ